MCLCVFSRVKDHHNLLHYSPRLKKACVRSVVLDKRFPLSRGGAHAEVDIDESLERETTIKTKISALSAPRRRGVQPIGARCLCTCL